MKDIEVSFPKPCNESWESMAPKGCHRHCAACDQTIHDLERMTFDQAIALLREQDDVCVRAKTTTRGEVQLKPSASPNAFKLKAAMGVAATLALAACSSTGSTAVSPRFSISGEVEHKWQRSERLELAGEGGTRQTRPDLDSSFQFTNLKPGTYTLSVVDNCGIRQMIAEVDVGPTDAQLGEVSWEVRCITVGKMEPVERPRRA